MQIQLTKDHCTFS